MLPPLPRRLLFAALLITITALALMPAPPRLPGALGWDKLNHVAGFLALALLARWAWPQARWTALWVGLMGYGVALEFAQSFTPNRLAEGADLVADALGIGLVQGADWLQRVLRRR